MTWGSLIFWFVYLCIYGLFFTTFPVGAEVFYVVFVLFQMPKFYFTTLLTVIASLLRDFAWK